MSKLKIIKDKHLCDAVKQNYSDSPYEKYINKISQIFSGNDTYLWGGAVRDCIIRTVHKVDFPTKDYDMLIDDSSQDFIVKDAVADLPGMDYNRFGGAKWKPESGLEIDIVPLSDANVLRAGKDLPISVETTLSTINLSTSKMAYGLQDGLIYDTGGMKSIMKKEIDINYFHFDKPHYTIAQCILHSFKFEFSIGESAKKYICNSYDDEVEELLCDHVMRYNPDKFDKVMDTIEKILVD